MAGRQAGGKKTELNTHSIGISFEVQTVNDQTQFNEHKTNDYHIQYIEL